MFLCRRIRHKLRFSSQSSWKKMTTVFSDGAVNNQPKLYEGHEPVTFLQRSLLAAGSAVMGLIQPTRSDMIAVLGETTGYFALRQMHKQMISDPEGQQILCERPIINTRTIDMDYLRSLPEGTFGKEYTNFMDGCQITSDTRDPVRFVDNEELAYVMLRYRQIHDFTHLLTGFPSVTVPNEIAVKWFEMVHFGLPMCALAAFFAPLRLTESERMFLREELIPWALYAGYTSKFFLNIYFEKHFEKDINEFRKEINLVKSPKAF